MPTKKERLDALEADNRALREEIELFNARVNNLAEGVVSVRMANGVLSEALTDAERKLNELTAAFALHNNAVVDGQAILGREQAALAARLDKLEQRAVGLQMVEQAVWPANDPAFPTGAATTVDEVLAAVPPTDDSPPRRGDRVRLEGARFLGRGGAIADGWYDVVGQEFGQFQFVLSSDLRRLGWLPNDHPGVKEIRRLATPQRPAIEPIDDKDLDV